MEDALAIIGTVDTVPFSTDHYTELQVTTPVQAKKPGKRPRNGAASGTDANRREYYEWSHGAVHSLLDIYEEKYSALQRGNLRGRHWHEVAHHVSSREEGTKSAKTSKQCKMKIENLKRRYKMEKTQRIGNSALAGASRWPYYERLDTMLGFTPKALAGGQRDCADTLSGSEPVSSHEANPKSKGAFVEPAVECEGESEMPAAAPVAEDREDRDVSPDVGDDEQEEGGPQIGHFGNRKDSKTDASEVNTMLNMPGTSGAKNNQNKLPERNSLSNPGVLLANSITAFAEVLARIEQAKMEMHKDLERQRTEADLKRTQMVLDNQLEIAKLVMKRRKRKGRSVSSSSESD
ncbi:hypothetical protein M758_2G128900 [Ceratodon purpureus]|nr:hypothetical protein M758_2G128900 [Ceratodon purpureus]